MRSLRLFLTAVGFGGALVMAAPTAQAACHAFTVSAEPAQVAEGDKVTVTVTRDAAANPSRVDLSSVDGTAKAGEDYPPQKRTISFMAETKQSFEMAITDDAVAEGDETFKLRLSNPGGCPANPNFQVGPDATVTIQRSDASTTTAAPTTAAPTTAAPTTAARPRPTTTAAATPATSAAPSVEPPGTDATLSTGTGPSTTDLEEADQALPINEDDDDGGSGVGLILVAVLAAAALAGGAAYFAYRRRSPGTI